MYHRLLAAGVVMGALTVLGAEDGKLALTAENWHGSKNVSFVEEGKSGGACIKATSRATIISKNAFPVDPAKKYRLTGSFKSAGEKEGKVYLGFQPLDAEEQEISSVQVIGVKRTETELVEACEAEDTVIKIKDGSKWRKAQTARVAFEADDSGEYTDLPNRNLSGAGIIKVEKKDNCWEVVLKKPCGMSCPAGTKVRRHNSGTSRMYCAAANVTVPSEWKTYSGEATGSVKSGNPADKFWPGTAYVKIVILANFMGSKDNVMLIDDIKIVEE